MDFGALLHLAKEKNDAATKDEVCVGFNGCKDLLKCNLFWLTIKVFLKLLLNNLKKNHHNPNESNYNYSLRVMFVWFI